MKRLFAISFCLFLMASTLTSCYVNKFDIGKGAQSNVTVKQWNHYLLDGLVPVNVSNPVQMAAGAADYTVTIKHSFINMILSGLTFGIYSPTTTVVQK